MGLAPEIQRDATHLFMIPILPAKARGWKLIPASKVPARARGADGHNRAETMELCRHAVNAEFTIALSGLRLPWSPEPKSRLMG